MRIDLGIDQRDQGIDHHPADTGKTAAQAVDLEHHDQAHQRITDRLTNPRCVGQHQRTLKVFEVIAGDFGRRQQSETGVDAVSRAVFGKNLFNTRDTGIDLRRSA